MRAWTAWVCAAVGLLASAGCGLKTYTLPPAEAQRIAEALRARPADQADEPIVAATVDEEGREVRVELHPDDELQVTLPGGLRGSARGLESALALGPEAQVSLVRSHRGTALLVGGLGLFAGGWLISTTLSAAQGDGLGTIPLAGPLLHGVFQGLGGMFSCMGHDDPCEQDNPTGALVGGVILSAMQVTGLVLTIAGGVQGLSREVTPETAREEEYPLPPSQDAPVTVEIEPLMTGDGGLGGLLTLRF